jgi:hypothetical protein
VDLIATLQHHGAGIELDQRTERLDERARLAGKGGKQAVAREGYVSPRQIVSHCVCHVDCPWGRGGPLVRYISAVGRTMRRAESCSITW